MEQQKVTPHHSEIAFLAEQLYVASGRIPGRDLENWLQAEEQLRSLSHIEPGNAERAKSQLGRGMDLKGKDKVKSAPGQGGTKSGS